MEYTHGSLSLRRLQRMQTLIPALFPEHGSAINLYARVKLSSWTKIYSFEVYKYRRELSSLFLHYLRILSNL